VTKTFYSTTELADLLKVNRVTVYRWVKEGKINAYGIGKHIKIHAAEVARLLCDFGLSGDVLDELCGGEENNFFDASVGPPEKSKRKKLVVAVDDDEAILKCVRELFARDDLSAQCTLMTFPTALKRLWLSQCETGSVIA
jgi:excisionase family DNA binding protein